MQEELTIEGRGFDNTLDTESATTTKTRTPRRTLRVVWQSLDEDRRFGIKFYAVAFSIIAVIVGSIVTTYKISTHNTRTQAVQRAQKMDGETYTIKGVSNNWIGDTRLFLENERGEDCGWVMIYMNNPLTSKVNPLFLFFSDKRHDPLPFPMRVRVHYRQEAWTDENVSSTKENFTGSFLEFEPLD